MIVLDIVRKLEDLDLVHSSYIKSGEAPISSIASDRRAQSGEVSWISQRVFDNEPQRIDTFHGTLLLTPPFPMPENRPRLFSIIQCNNPKLAFSRMVNELFPDLVSNEFSYSFASTTDSGARFGKNVRLGGGVVLGANVSVGDNVKIGPNSVLSNCSIGEDTSIGANTTIGLAGFGYEKDETGRYHRFPHLGKVIIGRHVEIGSNTCIDRGALEDTVIGDGCKIDNLVHIAHNVRLGRNCMVIANSMVAGSVEVGDNAWIAPSASILNQRKIGSSALIGMGAVVIRDVEVGQTVAGSPAREIGKKST